MANPFREALRASRPANPFRAALGEADRPPTPRPPTTSAAKARQQIAEPSSQAVLAQPEAATPAVAAPARQSAGGSVTQNVAEFFKGIPGGAVSMGGLALTGAGATSQGFVRDQMETMDRIDRGEFVPEIEDPIGYQHMTPEQRQQARAEVMAVASKPVAETPMVAAGRRITKTGREMIPAAPGYEESVGRQLGQATGTLVAGVGASALTGPMTAGMLFALSGSGEAVEKAIQSGATDEQIIEAARLGVIPGLTDSVPIETLLGRVPLPGGQFIKIPANMVGKALKVAGRIGWQGLIEGVQEGGQAFLQNAIAKYVHTPEQELGEGVLPEAGIGAGVGMIAETGRQIITSAAGRRGGAPRPQPAPSPEAPPVAPEDPGLVSEYERIRGARAPDQMPEMTVPMPREGEPVETPEQRAERQAQMRAQLERFAAAARETDREIAERDARLRERAQRVSETDTERAPNPFREALAMSGEARGEMVEPMRAEVAAAPQPAPPKPEPTGDLEHVEFEGLNLLRPRGVEEVDENGNPAGLQYVESDEARTVVGLFLPKGQRGKRLSTRIYEQAIQETLDAGKRFESDASITPDGQRTWDAMARRGYQIELADDAVMNDDGTIVSPGDKPIYTVRSRGTPNSDARAPRPRVATAEELEQAERDRVRAEREAVRERIAARRQERERARQALPPEAEPVRTEEPAARVQQEQQPAGRIRREQPATRDIKNPLVRRYQARLDAGRDRQEVGQDVRKYLASAKRGRSLTENEAELEEWVNREIPVEARRELPTAEPATPAEAGSQGAAPEDQIVAALDRDDFRAALAVFEGLKDRDIQRVARHVGLASAFIGLKGGTKKARLEALARVLPRATRSARGDRERQRINDLIQREIADLRRNLEENAAAVAEGAPTYARLPVDLDTPEKARAEIARLERAARGGPIPARFARNWDHLDFNAAGRVIEGQKKAAEVPSETPPSTAPVDLTAENYTEAEARARGAYFDVVVDGLRRGTLFIPTQNPRRNLQTGEAFWRLRLESTADARHFNTLAEAIEDQRQAWAGQDVQFRLAGEANVPEDESRFQASTKEAAEVPSETPPPSDEVVPGAQPSEGAAGGQGVHPVRRLVPPPIFGPERLRHRLPPETDEALRELPAYIQARREQRGNEEVLQLEHVIDSPSAWNFTISLRDPTRQPGVVRMHRTRKGAGAGLEPMATEGVIGPTDIEGAIRRAVEMMEADREKLLGRRPEPAPAPTPARRPRGRPQRLAGFLISRGGIREDPTNRGELSARDLRKRKKGLVNNKRGMTLDDAALAAWEAGFLPGPERPSPDDLLRALERDLRGEPVVREVDQAEMDALVERASSREAEERAREAIRDYAQEIGEEFAPAEIDEIMRDMIARDIDAQAAVSDFAERLAVRAAEELADATGDESYADIPFEPIQDDRTAEARGQGQARAAEVAPAGQEGRAVVEEDRPTRYEIGRSLTREQRQQVLDSLTDRYKEAGLQKEFAGTDRRGNESYRYPHRPDLFVKSDITGAMLRYYVTLPDGRIAHPTELFPNYTQSNVEKEMARREAEEQNTRLWLDKYIREDRQFDTLEEATRFWNEQSANSVSPVHGQPTILPASERVPFYKDGKVALVDRHTASMGRYTEALAEMGWRREPERSTPTIEQVPEAVRRRVQQSLEYLREIEQRVAEAADLERRVGGTGRYQADVFSNRAQDIERARSRIAEFRRIAAERGIDPEPIIAELGGEPSLTPSPEAQAWLERPEQGPVETEPRPTTEQTPEGEQFVLPGAEQRPQREVLERRMAQRDVRGGQRGLEGLELFDEGARAEQEDLFGSIARFGRKLTPQAEAQRDELADLLERLVRKINPDPELAVEFANEMRASGATVARHGLDPSGTYEQVGSYSPAQHLIRLSLSITRGERVGAAAHEAWHSVERLLTPEERQTLLDAYPTRDGVVHVERAAIAFEEYMLGELQAKPAVRRIFAKIANFLRQLGNALRGRGFRTVEDVFERAASGEIGARFLEGPPAGATTVDPDTGRPVSRFAKPPEDIQRVVAAGATLLRPVNAQTLGMVRAYHGSPHRFDRFSMEKIGTGEGAQAYGHGLYFAENPAIAGYYQSGLSYKQIVRDFREALPDDADFSDVMELVGTGHFTPYQERVLKALETDDWLGFDYPSQAIAAAYRDLDAYDASQELRDAVRSVGVLYNVTLDVEPEDLLDWDAPLSQQSEKVKAALRQMSEIRQESRSKGAVRHFLTTTDYDIRLDQALAGEIDVKGAVLYRLLSGALGGGVRRGAEAAASRALAEAGIPGLRYFDAGSRGTGEGTRNVVMFRDDLIRIEAVDGQPVAGDETLGSVKARQSPGFQPFTDEDGVVRFHAGLPFGKLWDWWLGPFFAKHWHTFGRLPGGKSAYMRPRRKTQGRIDEFDQLARDIYQKLGQFDGATLEKVFEYLTTAGASADMVPQPARVVAADVKKLINEMSHELLWRGAISQAQFDAYKDSYLPQLYLKHVLEEGMIGGTGARPIVSRSMMGRLKKRKLTPEAAKKFEKGAVDLAFMDAGENAAVDVYPAQVAAEIRDYLATPNAKTDMISDPAAREPMKALKGRILLRFYQEVMLGRVKDPAYLAARAISEAARSVAIWDFLEVISGNPDWIYPGSTVDWRGRKVSVRWLKAEAEHLRQRMPHYPASMQDHVARTADEMDAVANQALLSAPDVTEPVLGGLFRRELYKQVPDSKRYGYMRGLWVRKEIYDDIVGSISPQYSDAVLNQVASAARKANSLYKGFKTAWSIPAQVRNFMGGYTQSHLYGRVPFARMPDMALQTIHDLATNGPAWQAAKRNGVKSTSFAQSELLKIHDDFKRRETEKKYRNHLHLFVRDLFVAINNKLGDAYSMNEQFWKTLVIKYHMAHGMSEEDAADLAHEAIFDYSDVPQMVRFMRSVPLPFVSPFITFTYKAIPASLEAALKRPWSYLPYAVMTYGSWAFLQSLWDLDDEEADALWATMQDWLQHGLILFLPGKDEHGRWQPIDLSYILPFSPPYKMLYAAMKGDLKELGQEIGVMSHPYFATPAAILSNHDFFTEREVYTEGAPPQQQLQEVFTYLLRQLAPSRNIEIASGIYDALQGTPTRRGEPGRTPGQAALRGLGINIFAFDAREERKFKIYLMDRDIRDAEMRLSRIRRDRSLSREAKREETERQREHIRRLKRERSEFARLTARAPR